MKLKDRYNSNQKLQKEMIRIFKNRLGNNKYRNSLDVGCNNGFWTYVGSIHLENVVLCDLVNNCSIDELNGLNLNSTFIIADGTELPFDNDTFDFVYSMDVIEHVDDYDAFFKEHLRVCKSSGRVIVGTPNLNRFANILRKLTGQLQFPRKLGEDDYGDVIHIREFSQRDLYDLIAKNIADIKSFEVVPCYLGIGLDFGVRKFPRFFDKYSQFLFMDLTKK